MATQRRGFSSNIGAILAAAGGAVGLGNVWRFPYMLGKNGGGAFLLVYIFFVFLIGIPIMMTEFVMGRSTQSNVVGAYRKMGKKKAWIMLGVLTVIAAFLIYAYYSVVAGWTLNYIAFSISGKLHGLDPSGVGQAFSDFTRGSFWPVVNQLVFLALTGFVISFGVEKGIERVSKVLMPLLFALLVIMCVRSLTLPGAVAGLEFLFRPDFSKITGETLLSALGQSFFSMSLGLGGMITYGSYIRKQDSLLKTSAWISVCDLMVAILSGIVIFPAVFSFGLNPAAGPELVYVVLPNVFNSMSGGVVFAAVFFVLLGIAALTSTISLLEIIVAVAVEEFNWKRRTSSVVITIAVFIVGVFCTLSFGPLRNFHIFGRTIFEFFDMVTASYILPIGALATCLLVGWGCPKDLIASELSQGSRLKSGFIEAYFFIVRYVAPIGLAIILISGLVS